MRKGLMALVMGEDVQSSVRLVRCLFQDDE
jgi:hypothetical protein